MKPLRLVLSPEQSAAFRESGINFAVAGPGSYSDADGRICLYLFQCDQKQATDACGVAAGNMTAKKPTKPKP